MQTLLWVYLIGLGMRSLLLHGLFSSGKSTGLNVDVQLFVTIFWPFFMLWNVWAAVKEGQKRG